MTQRREDETSRRQQGDTQHAGFLGSAENLAHFFEGMDFPATKQDLLRHIDGVTPREVQLAVERLPESGRFASLDEVIAAYQQANCERPI